MKSHFIHLLILAAILGIGGYAFFSIQGNQAMQLVVGSLTTITYVGWGILHHALQRDLHRRVVIEYVLIGALAELLLLIVLIS